MFDDLPGVAVAAAVFIVVVGTCVLIGSCVNDYRTSTPRTIEVLITDKHYSPAHTDTYVTLDANGNSTIHSNYYPESWTVEYADEERHTINVSSATYAALQLGERKVLHYDLGGGFWQARYNERFEFGMVRAEALPIK